MSGVLVAAALRRTDPRAAVDPLTGAVTRDGRAATASAADLCALEHALRLAGALGGCCVAVTVGPADCDVLLREALAAGAHEVVRAEGPDHDAAATARTLHEALTRRHGPPDLVVCGDRSADRGTGSTPAFLAARLGASQALGLLELEAADGGVRALRRLDGGRRERLCVPLPAVCSVEATDVRLRRAALPAVLAARTAAVPVVTVDPPTSSERVRTVSVRPYRPRPKALPGPGPGTPRERMLALSGAFVPRTPPRVVTSADPAEAVDELLAFLRSGGYLPKEAP
ncbi:mycofactocin-associated electron transfer flavoprotein beta subunit [Streptomyces sp. NPDC008313]|uniref:mycofactocin-associated electron transfer flavoprotein beta subunit n=1 Tax=Streptomyces sp. NPDC008313 TaxID=3364826 RepID=UPI0036E4844C